MHVYVKRPVVFVYIPVYRPVVPMSLPRLALPRHATIFRPVAPLPSMLHVFVTMQMLSIS